MKKQEGALWISLAGAVAVMLSRQFMKKTQKYDFEGKVVLVTGGSNGLGLILARHLLKKGAKVVISGNDINELERARHELSKVDHEITAIPCDISNRPQVDKMMATIEKNFGQLDVLINNDEARRVGNFESLTYEDYDHSMSVNFWGALHATMAALPGMKKRQEGRIINVSSLAGKISFPKMLPYSASKFALTGLSEGLHAELKKSGISVTTACPGFMENDTFDNYGIELSGSTVLTQIEESNFLSVGSDKAAEEILKASARGEAEAVISLPGKILAGINGLVPGMISDWFSYLNEKLIPHSSREVEKERLDASGLPGVKNINESSR